MRLLYVSSSTVPSTAANSVQVVRMCDAFADGGHDVLLVARPGRGVDDDVASWYGTRNRFEVDTGLWSGRRGLGMALTARRVAARARIWGADVAYGRDPIGLLGAARAGVPVGFEVHHPPETAIRAAIEERLLAHPMLRRVVAITEALAVRYRPLTPDDVEVVVAHDAADDPGPPPVTETSAGAGPIGYCGSLRPGKGGELLCAVARRLPELQFVAVGGSPTDVERLAAAAPANLDLRGAVPPAAVGAALRSFGIALAPYGASVRGATGAVDLAPWMSPLKVYEYLAHGLPIVASDLPVLREVLVDSVNCALIRPDDAGAWAEAVSGLVADPHRLDRLAAGARQTFLAGHTWRARAGRVLDGLVPNAPAAPLGGRR